MPKGRALAAAAALALLAAALGGALPGSGRAQDRLSMGQVQSPVLVVDLDRLLAGSRLGRRLGADLDARGAALAAENRRIEAELDAEEDGLTERRPGMDPDAFRAEADAFDAKVQRIRAEQDAKERAFEDAVAAGRQEFLAAATPVLAQLMADSGAAVILERRSVFLVANPVDVTDEAIDAIDAAIGAGEAPEGAPGEAPGPDAGPPPG